MRIIRDILKDLPTSPDKGLTAEGVAASRQRFGVNRLTPLPREPLWKKFLDKFDEPIIKILLAAALLSMVVDLFRPTPSASRFETLRYSLGGAVLAVSVLLPLAATVLTRQQWIPSILFVSALTLWPIGLATGHASFDGLAVMVAVILATGVAFASEYKSDREFELLNAQKDALQVKVERGGEFHTVP